MTFPRYSPAPVPPRRARRISFARLGWPVLGLLAGCAAPLVAPASEADAGAVAIYRFDEQEGEVVRDSSGNRNDGRVVGGVTRAPRGVAGGALMFNGRNSVRIPSSPKLELGGAHSISAWMRGRPSPLHFVDGFTGIWAPYFQVTGDTIHLGSFSSEPYDNAVDRSRGPNLQGKEIFHLYTGSADISLANWTYTRRTQQPFTGFEPRLQVVEDKVYYEYSGDDPRHAVQIWTAEEARNGSGWKAWQRTDEARFELLPPGWDARKRDYSLTEDRALYRHDHGAIAVAAGKIFIAYPAQDKNNVWQLWTSVSNLDGSGYRSFQRTTDRGWIPSGVQAAGDRVYYLYSKGDARFETYSHSNNKGTAQGPKTVEGFYFGSTDLAGEDWRVVQRVGGPCPSGDSGSFHVSNGRIYLMWAEFQPDGQTQLFTGAMDVDGRNFTKVARFPEKAYAKLAINGSVQVVGQRVYYLFAKRPLTNPPGEFHLWTAESNLDGSDWAAEPLSGAARGLAVGYRGPITVGAKRYFGPGKGYEGVLGFAGANLVNKGDAYGLGVTEAGKLRGFVNAGQDYLFRGEAAIGASGATADAAQPIAENSWYHVVQVYDRQRVHLYVNGALQASTPYRAPPGRNPFPLVIGDGFVGIVDEVSVYDRGLSADEVARHYRARQPR
ncbi:MAG: LamG domain-containing protein [Opitutus sp.]|nr:LamG domain-containing protein [Opitutus sp.]